MTDIARVLNFHELAHDGRVVDLLAVIELAAAWIAGCMHMADDGAVLIESP